MDIKKKVLFVGNSFTLHAPAPNIGWHGNWGMAASCQANDYAHVMLHLFEGAGIAVEPRLINIADWEQRFWDYDLEALREQRAFGADILILRVAENVDEKEAADRDFAACYEALIRYLDPGGKAMVVCSNGFGEHDNANRQIAAVAQKHGWPMADLSALFYNDENKALAMFEDEGVRAHPSDTGMATIANILFSFVMREIWRQK